MKTKFKTLKIALICFLIIPALSSMKKPLTINVPPGLGTVGTLVPPITIDPVLNPDVWTVVNNSNCSLTVNVFFTVNGKDMFIPVDLIPGASQAISSADVLALYDLPSTSQITHSAIGIIQWHNNGALIAEFYPGERLRREKDIPGCNCVFVDWNVSTRTITITNC